jgi:putative tryptophan/tyrosine transport system substrate-binding protein
MRRREFISALIGGAAAARPLAGIAAVLAPGSSRAQAPNTIRRLGVLMSQTVSDPTGQARVATLVQALGAFHWREGDNLRIDWRWGGGDPALFERYAGELGAGVPDAA